MLAHSCGFAENAKSEVGQRANNDSFAAPAGHDACFSNNAAN